MFMVEAKGNAEVCSTSGGLLAKLSGQTMPCNEVCMNKQLLRVNEAAELLNVSRWTVYRWVEDGKLSASKIGTQSLRVITHSVD